MNARLVTLIATMLVSASVLSACAIEANVDPRQYYQESLANYQSCLAANPSNEKICETQRLKMEADESAYNNVLLATK
jgi:hypothetical protein